MGLARAPAPASPTPPQDDEATVIMERPALEALADAARSAPKPAPHPAPQAAPSRPELPDWYVGIDGEPVGPVDVTFIRRQIALGKVDEASLVWREELTDWKQLKTFPELAKLVAELGKAAPVVPSSAVSDPVALTRRKPEDDAPQVEVRPAGTPAPAAERPKEPERVQPDRHIDLSHGPSAAAAPVPAPAARAPSAAPRDSAPPDSELYELAGLPRDRRRRRRGMHPMAYAFIAMAAAFGAVAAWVLFTSKSQPDAASGGEVAATDATASADAPATAVPSAEGSAIELTEVDISTNIPEPPAPGKAPSPGPETGPKTSGGAPKKCSPDDPFCGVSDVGGPSAKGPGSGGDGSGQGLSQDQVQSVVNRNRHAVSRKCMSYVTGKGGGSAKVGVTLVIAPSGAVQSVSASGGSEYPGLASCVRSRVSNWSFPASGASTTVNIPFHFVTQ